MSSSASSLISPVTRSRNDGGDGGPSSGATRPAVPGRTWSSAATAWRQNRAGRCSLVASRTSRSDMVAAFFHFPAGYGANGRREAPGPFGWLEVRGGDTEFPGRVRHHGQVTAALGPAA